MTIIYMKTAIAGLIICSMFLVGYIMNIYKTINLDWQSPYKAEIIRGVGVTSGLGGIIGYLDIKDN